MTYLELPTILTSRAYGSDPLRQRVRQGELERIRRGAYLSPTEGQTRWARSRLHHLARCVAVSQRLTTAFAFSHATAALLHGWPAPITSRQVEIVQRTMPSRHGKGDIRRHWRPSLSDADVVEVNGLPVTTRSQTVLDCIRQFNPREGLVLADHALHVMADADRRRRSESLARADALRAEWLDMLAELGPAAHVRRAGAVLRYTDGLAGSPAESQCRWLALVVGLPEPICEWETWVDGHRYFSDMAWLADADDWQRRAITFEYDGRGKYGNTVDDATSTMAAEKDREDAIASLDVAIHRITKERLANAAHAQQWMLSKFPPSTRARLTPRPRLAILPS